jgi:hypothetical protein
MRLRESPAVSLLLPLVFSLLLVGFLAGCGGQSGGGQEKKQEDKGAAASKAHDKAHGEAARKEPLPRKIAIGTVRAFKDDKRRLSLRPATDAQGKKPLGFKVRKNADVTLGGKEAELADIEEGQQAQIAYVVEHEVNRAVVVQLFEANEKPSDGGKKKEQPSDGGKKTG